MSDERDAQGKSKGAAATNIHIHSFSQLPFIRLNRDKKPPPPASNPAPMRLFGFDVPPHAATPVSPSGAKESTPAAEATAPIMAPGPGASGGNNNGGRRFECRYCFRNFRTSQALGGHQNAHKQERQHAKRARFQTAMAMRHGGGHYYPLPLPLDPAHLYHRPSYAAGPAPAPHYPAWAGAAYYMTPPGPIMPTRLWRPRDGSGGAGAGTTTLVAAGGAGSTTLSQSTTSSSSWSTSPHQRRLLTLQERKENVSLDLSL